MIAFLLALAIPPSFSCAMTLGVNVNGTIYSNRADRLQSWYIISSKTLDSDLRGGCYNDANLTPVTTVKVLLAPDAPKSKVNLVFSILERDGWKRNRISVKSWDGKPPSVR